MRINRHDTDGNKPLLGKGELGYDDYSAGGDTGRVYVGTGNENIPLAKKAEILAVDNKADAHMARVDNPHGVTKAQVGLGLVDNTADASKKVLSATKWTTARTITLSGDIAGSASVDGSANVTIATTVQPNSVALGTDTTGNYVAGVTAGQGITISGTAEEGWSPTIALSALDLTLFPTSNFKKSVKVATTYNITLSGAQTIDGISVVAGDRVLVKNQTTASQNGIYIVNASTWTRSVAADGSNEIDSAVVGVDQGTTNGGRFFTNTFKTTDTVGTTAMPWYEVATTSSTVSSANTLATARTVQTNLGSTTSASFDGSVNIAPGVTGTLPVSNGGTGATTLTGLVKGNGTSAMSAAVAGTDYVVPSGSITGNAASATKLQTARTIGGVSFDGTVNIDLPGVNKAGTQSTTGNAGSASKLATARTINGVSFDGTTNITIADSTKAPLSHNHDASHINAGTLSLDRLPTIPNTKISGLGTASTRDVGTSVGNVMEVGAFGLMANSLSLLSPGSGTDQVWNSWNNIISGWGTGSMTGTPPTLVTTIGKVLNIGVENWGTQLFFDYYGKQMFFRGKESNKSTPEPWNEITHSGNLLTSTGQSTTYPMTQKAVTNAIQGVSDARDKTNIQNTNIGLELIEKLNVVTYNLNKRDWYRTEEATITEEIELEDGTKNTTTRVDDKILKTDLKKYDKNDGHLTKNSIYTGLIAQDVKEAYESLGLDLSIVKNMKDEYEGGDDQYYIEYNGVIPLLINAIKELNNKVKSLEDKLRPEGGN